MSAATDKARFFLEKSVPELKEYERKKIFSKDEITAIIKKRSDFEHKLNARGAQPSDFVRYAEYEMNLDALRRKRVKRLGIRGAGYSGQRRIFFILDRATRKFHGDIGLWIQYIEYARAQKAFKKLSTIFDDVLRLHPTNVDLWIYAAQYALDDHADMTQSRSHMQRGLRFCKSSRKLWIHYAKLELIYTAKLVARQRILGLDREIEAPKPMSDASFEDPNADMIALPQITGEDINPSAGDSNGVDQVALENLRSTPAMSGAIPLAIFDTAMKNFEQDAKFGREFFDMVVEFPDLPCLRKILEHVVNALQQSSPTSHHTQICYIKLPTAGVQPTSPDFPRALITSFARLKEHRENPNVAKEVINWLQPLENAEGLDPSLQKAITATVRNAERVL
ncbi:U3 small nucleolar RNA-associated protein 6-domain-containing protein [Aspergillus caelatus]|uniref:U3 small nucleolar RNA-associated protein 6-domain-containing protein n=1 Tax=Aspergillus caelatus TaxID=61420 RepID=A0A5N7AL95_9EURO|nr:U3 small nucleolar RNA-associated protein 6-domain-containing protein [Aspergillus caelatus]KAE8369480.1 U3 small nucleolar RNA-associated protein 6-domain-containing protein [Aspergillus caelatus]